MLLSSIIDNVWSNPPFLLIQSSTAQSGFSIFRQVLARNLEAPQANHLPHTLLFCLVHPPSSLLPEAEVFSDNLQVHDWTCMVPGYEADWKDPRAIILSIVKTAPPGPLHVAFDSMDTLPSDIGSLSETYVFFCELLALIRGRPSPSCLTLHALRPSELVPLLIQPAFSPSLAYLVAHPPAILTHIAKEYLIPPPPVSSPTKFWDAFLPLSERTHDVDRMIFGTDGEGCGSPTESVVEILLRRIDGPGRKRGVERILEGWNIVTGSACDLMKLEGLKTISTKPSREVVPDPIPHASFNLNLTSSQQESRSRVPLPYVHEGNLSVQQRHPSSGIFYDPDSADDLDDDDPDEDLDI